MEIITTLVAEDFEPGDRIYTMTNRGTRLGTVLSVIPEDTIVLTAQMDDGPIQRFTAADLASHNRLHDKIGKPLNLEFVERGSIISREDDNGRVYAEVLYYYPKEEIAIKLLAGNNRIVVTETKYSRSIEEQMILWEVEP